MSERSPQVHLARHGETAWTISGQHTGLTDLPLTPRGEENARRLGERLRGLTFAQVFTSSLQRARQTGASAGFPTAVVDPELVEWNYGRYEGLKTAEIHKGRPTWDLFRDGCPDGESPAAISARADRVIARLRGVLGDVLLFSSGHFLRVLAARWLGLDGAAGRHLFLGTTALSVLGYEHTATEPVIRLWNDVSHASA
jgi:probable phosphoglycerate mutase